MLSSGFGTPLAPRVHVAGGVPSTVPDVPVCAVLILAYLVGAAGNVMLFVVRPATSGAISPH